MNSTFRPVVLFLVIILAAILQMTVFSRLTLLHGSLDLILLTLVAWTLQEHAPNMWPWTLLAGAIISFASAVPFLLAIPAYLLVTAVARVVQRRIWQSPILAMLLVSLLGTLIIHFMTMAALFLNGTSLRFDTAWTQVTVPSLLLNLLLAIPVYATVQSIHEQISPKATQT